MSTDNIELTANAVNTTFQHETITLNRSDVQAARETYHAVRAGLRNANICDAEKQLTAMRAARAEIRAIWDRDYPGEEPPISATAMASDNQYYPLHESAIVYTEQMLEAEILANKAANAAKPALFDETLDDPGDDEDVFLIAECLVANQPMFVGGKSKTMKTAIIIDMAFSLSAGPGYKFLNKYDVLQQCNVGVFSGESGKTTLKRRWRTIKATRTKLGDTVAPVRIEYKVPALSDAAEIARVVEAIRKHKLTVLIFDPMYLGLLKGNRKVEASNVFAMGELMQGIIEACVAEGCTPIFLHHDKKSASNDSDVSELEDFSMAGFAEIARQWIKIKRRPGKAYAHDGVHELNISVSGSASFSSAYTFIIEEGDHKNPKWKVSCEALVSSRDEKKRNAEVAKQQKAYEDRMRVFDAVLNCPNISTDRIAKATHLGVLSVESHLAALMAEHKIDIGQPKRKDGSAWLVPTCV